MSKMKIIIICFSLCLHLFSFGQIKIDSLEKVLNSLPEDINRVNFRNDSIGTVNEWNQSAEKITTITKDEVMDNNLVEKNIIEDNQKAVKQVLYDAFCEKETSNYKSPLYTKDNYRVMVLLNTITRKNVDGKVVSVLNVGKT